MSSDFSKFKTSAPARAIFEKMGLREWLDAAETWRQLRYLIVDYNDPNVGRFVTVARRLDGVASSGERALLHAILYVTDFAWLADELSAGKAWQKMDSASGAYRDAVAACIGADI